MRKIKIVFSLSCIAGFMLLWIFSMVMPWGEITIGISFGIPFILFSAGFGLALITLVDELTGN